MPHLSRAAHAPFALLLLALLACKPAPEIKQVSPAEGTIVSGGTVTVSGIYAGVDPANAIVLVNGAPAAIAGTAFSGDVPLVPGANGILVELRDASLPEVRKRARIAVLRGAALDVWEFAPDAIALRFHDSFFEALPMREIAEAALLAFVESEAYEEHQDFIEGEFGSSVLEAVIDLAGTLEVTFTESEGLRASVSPNLVIEGEFDGPLGSTCGVSATIDGEIVAVGDLEPGGIGSSLSFSGTVDADVDVDLDVFAVGGLPVCDIGIAEQFAPPIQDLVDEFADEIVLTLLQEAARAVDLEVVRSFCPFDDEDCPEEDELGIRLDASLQAVDELDGAVEIDGDARVRSVTAAAPPSLLVPGDALPVFGDLTPSTGQPYDAALALTPTAINQLLAVAAAEAARSVDLTERLDPALIAGISSLISGLPAFVRLEIPTAPVLTGEVLCPGGLALPELRLANARLIVSTEIEGIRGDVVTMSFDVQGGVRLWPRRDADGLLGLGIDVVIGGACPGTGVQAFVLSIPSQLSESNFLFGLALMPIGQLISEAIAPLPFDEIVQLDGLAGLPIATIGFQPVEIVNAGSSFAVYANLLVDGEGGSFEPLALVSSRFGDGVDGWSFLLGSLTHVTSGGPAGSGDGHLRGIPNAESLTSYYVAPGKFLGDWSSYTRLMLEMESSGGSYYDSDFGYRGDIYLESGSATAQYDFGHRPASSWEPFSVPLGSDAGWTFGGGATTLAPLLRNVTRFEIRGEYGFGGDDSRLDDVRLVLDP